MIDWKIIYLFEILFSQQERTNDGTEATLTAISQITASNSIKEKAASSKAYIDYKYAKAKY
jgi:hypothetical protein